MKPWRRIVPYKNGDTRLPKECEEFLVYVPPDYTTKILSRGAVDGLLLNAEPLSDVAGQRAIYGIKRGALWVLVTVVGTPVLGADKLNTSSPPPYLTPAGNIIEVNTIDADGVPTGNRVFGVWR